MGSRWPVLRKGEYLGFPRLAQTKSQILKIGNSCQKVECSRRETRRLLLFRPGEARCSLGTLGHLQPMSGRKWTSVPQLHGNESRPHLHKQEKGFLRTEIKSLFRHLCLSHRRPVSDSWLTKSENNIVMLFEATKIMAICHSRLEHGRTLETCGTHYLIRLLAFGKGEGRIEFFGRASGTWNLSWFCRLAEFDQGRRRYCVPFLGKFREQWESGLWLKSRASVGKEAQVSIRNVFLRTLHARGEIWAFRGNS